VFVCFFLEYSYFCTTFPKQKRRGPQVPSFLLMKVMINKEIVHSIVGNFISGSDMFLVDISVSAGNKIKVLVDRPEGLGISDCAELSRAIESSLDRESQDFELEVSSPGAESVFKVSQQFLKNVGKEVEIRLQNQNTLRGVLLEYTPEFLRVLPQEKGKKKNQTATDGLKISFAEIAQVKGVISFTFK
jgi:ribosome maturation factor RimP